MTSEPTFRVLETFSITNNHSHVCISTKRDSAICASFRNRDPRIFIYPLSDPMSFRLLAVTKNSPPHASPAFLHLNALDDIILYSDMKDSVVRGIDIDRGEEIELPFPREMTRGISVIDSNLSVLLAYCHTDKKIRAMRHSDKAIIMETECQPKDFFPRDLRLSPSGDEFIAVHGFPVGRIPLQIRVFSMEGHYLRSIPLTGYQPSHLSAAMNIMYAPNGCGFLGLQWNEDHERDGLVHILDGRITLLTEMAAIIRPVSMSNMSEGRLAIVSQDGYVCTVTILRERTLAMSFLALCVAVARHETSTIE